MFTVLRTLTFNFFWLAYRKVVLAVQMKKRRWLERVMSCLACSPALIGIGFLKEERILDRA
jgi:hypothetical protein